MLAILSLIKNIFEANYAHFDELHYFLSCFYNLDNHITGEHYVSDFALSPLHLIG